MKTYCRFLIVFSLLSASLFAEDNRTQYPAFLSKAYFGVNVGAIYYPFGNQHLPAGYHATRIPNPRTAPRITLLGYNINDHFSARITYLRPVVWMSYDDINADNTPHSVWMNVGGLTLKAKSKPKTAKLAFYGEAGLGLVTRQGFKLHDVPVIKDAGYATVLAGGGIERAVNRNWTLDLNVMAAPGKKDLLQPHIASVTTGFTYNIQPLPQERVERNQNASIAFPKSLLQLVYSSNAAGYRVNHFVAEKAVPIFWGGLAEVRDGYSVNYQRNVFHTKKFFSLDVGGSIGLWQSRKLKQHFATVSAYPLFRFTPVRTKLADFYFNYSFAGPSFISKISIDDQSTGRNFTFRDSMGIGFYVGPSKNVNIEWGIAHFSNGNIFPSNAGVKIPLSLHLGYAFSK